MPKGDPAISADGLLPTWQRSPGGWPGLVARADSDVDILVDFKEGADLFDLIELLQYLEEKIGRHVDLATPRALRPEIRDGIYRDVVYA